MTMPNSRASTMSHYDNFCNSFTEEAAKSSLKIFPIIKKKNCKSSIVVPISYAVGIKRNLNSFSLTDSPSITTSYGLSIEPGFRSRNHYFSNFYDLSSKEVSQKYFEKYNHLIFYILSLSLVCNFRF